MGGRGGGARRYLVGITFTVVLLGGEARAQSPADAKPESRFQSSLSLFEEGRRNADLDLMIRAATERDRLSVELSENAAWPAGEGPTAEDMLEEARRLAADDPIAQRRLKQFEPRVVQPVAGSPTRLGWRLAGNQTITYSVAVGALEKIRLRVSDADRVGVFVVEVHDAAGRFVCGNTNPESDIALQWVGVRNQIYQVRVKNSGTWRSVMHLVIE